MMPVYCSSKAALDMITKSAALQLAPKGIRVNSVNPGPVATNIMRGAGVTLIKWARQCSRSTVNSFRSSSWPSVLISRTLCCLANDKLARNITGSIVVSDSGMLLDPGCMRDALKEMEEMHKQMAK